MFGELWDRDITRHYLTKYIKKGSSYHPLLLTGEEGIGKKFLSQLIYRYVNCSGDQSSSCSCPSCTNPEPEDYVLYQLEKKSWGVNDVRELITLVEKPPLSSRFRVIAIDQAEKITPEGTDTFLKVVEDVDLYNIFVFLTRYYMEVLPTLRSRCWRVYVPPMHPAPDKENEELGVPEYQIKEYFPEREKALTFIESFFEPETLLNISKVREYDLETLLWWCNFVLSLYFLDASNHVCTRIKRLEEKYGILPLLIVYDRFNKLFQTMKRYPSIRVWHHFFQTVLDTGIQVKVELCHTTA